MNYEQEIKDIKQRLDNLQKSFVQAQKNQVPITNRSDTAYGKVPQVDSNTNGVSENSDAVIDVAALSDENSTAITDLGDYAGSLDERITELEGKING